MRKNIFKTTDGHGWTRMVLVGLVTVQAMTACAQFTPPTGGRRTVMTTDAEYTNTVALAAGSVQPITDGNLELTATSNITLLGQDEIILVPVTALSVYAGAGDDPTMSITPDEVVIGPALVTGMIGSPTTITVSAEESIELNSDALDASIWGNIKLEASDLSGPSSKLDVEPNSIILESLEGYKEARVIATNGTVAVEWKGGIADSLHRHQFGALTNYFSTPVTVGNAVNEVQALNRSVADTLYADISINDLATTALQTNDVGSAAFASTNDFVSSSVDNLTAWNTTDGGVLVENLPYAASGNVAAFDILSGEAKLYDDFNDSLFGNSVGVDGPTDVGTCRFEAFKFGTGIAMSDSFSQITGPTYSMDSFGINNQDDNFTIYAWATKYQVGRTYGYDIFQIRDGSGNLILGAGYNYYSNVGIFSDYVAGVDVASPLESGQTGFFEIRYYDKVAYLYVDGVRIANTLPLGDWTLGEGTILIGRNNGGNNYGTLKIDDFVLLKGAAIPGSTSSVPTEQYTPSTTPLLTTIDVSVSNLVEAVDLATTALQTNDVGSAAFAAVEDFAAASLTNNVSALESGTNTWNSAVQPTTDGNLDLTATSNITLLAQDEIILVPVTGMSVYAGAGDDPTMSITPDEVVIGPALVAGQIESPTTITVSADNAIELNSDALDASIWGDILLKASDLSGPSSKLKVAPNSIILESGEGYKEARVIATNGTVAVEWKSGIADSLHRYEFGAGITTNLNGLVIVNGSITGTY